MIKDVIFSTFVEESPTRPWIDKDGREVLDDTPVSIPINLPAPPSSMMELIHQLYRDMDPKNYESFADADDFDIEDDEGIEMVSSPYEQNFDHLTENSAPPSGSVNVPPQLKEVAE